VRMAVLDAGRLDRLTRDLLDLTRLEAGVTVLRRRPVGAAALVDQALQPFYARAAAAGVALAARVDPALPPVSGDLEQLARVVANLVDNALRYTPAGGHVTVTAAAAGGGVAFAIADDGAGIPDAYLARVFDRFFQVPGTAAGGAGLGLPIARKIVDAHGGTMAVESAVGQGTTFRFTVPAARPDGAPAAPGRQEA